MSPGTTYGEGDASCASYFDVSFASVMEQMGATVTWAPDAITSTRDTTVTPKLHGVALMWTVEKFQMRP